MEAIRNLNTYDPFADEGGSKYDRIVAATRVNIRTNQRTKWKYITICEGLHPETNCNKILRALKKNFSCNGTFHAGKDGTQIVQLQGDHRKQLVDFLTETGICLANNITVHGV